MRQDPGLRESGQLRSNEACYARFHQLARAVRNRTTGVLYVLDEPSIGRHPSNIDGLLELIGDLLADGDSVLVVDHDVQVLRDSHHIIEIGPGSGSDVAP